MQAKKLLAAALAGALVLTAAPVVPAAVSTSLCATAQAKGGGVKMAAPKAAPKAPAKTAPEANKSGSNAGTQQNARPETKNNVTNKHSTTNQQSGSRFGSILRGIGIFAGGMFLGSMLASLFGMGSGMLADILGMLANVVLIFAVVMGLKWLWHKFRGNRRQDDDYRAGYEAAMREQQHRGQQDIIDVTPQAEKPHIQDIQPPDDRFRK
ncbi:MAG: hypothetical protein SOZ01_07995 [Selenomonadaceae bacterium]|nr:hypothetical protein [Selenomonadaceae bacterium]